MGEVFIAYGSADRERVMAIVRDLEAAGVSVWVDRAGIDGALLWGQEIVEAIESCRAVLLVISRASIGSPNVVKEISLASEACKPILPLLLEPVVIPRTFRYALAGIQHIEVGPAPWEHVLSAILRALVRLGVTVAPTGIGKPESPSPSSACPSDLPDRGRPRFMNLLLSWRPVTAAVLLLIGSGVLYLAARTPPESSSSTSTMGAAPAAGTTEGPVPDRARTASAITTTLDPGIQQLAQDALSRGTGSSDAVQGQVVVLDPKDGAILAYATSPSWQMEWDGALRLPFDIPQARQMFEPGGVFAIVPVVAVREDGLVREDELLGGHYGRFDIGSHTIVDVHRGGPYSLTAILKDASNTGLAALSLRLSTDRLVWWAKAFGFGQLTGVEIIRESAGHLPPEGQNEATIRAGVAMGFGLGVTAVQLAAAYGALANDGVWNPPHFTPGAGQGRRICSPDTARSTRWDLEDVVTDGTGQRAAIPGYRIGGKTGTARKTSGAGDWSGDYVVTFVAMLPIESPRVVITVVIDQPRTSVTTGGAVAAPIVRDLARRLIERWQIPPTVRPEQPTPSVGRD